MTEDQHLLSETLLNEVFDTLIHLLRLLLHVVLSFMPYKHLYIHSFHSCSFNEIPKTEARENQLMLSNVHVANVPLLWMFFQDLLVRRAVSEWTGRRCIVSPTDLGISAFSASSMTNFSSVSINLLFGINAAIVPIRLDNVSSVE